MYSLTEHGLLLRYTSEEEFSLAKDKLDRIAKLLWDELQTKHAMHAIAIPDYGGRLLLTCLLQSNTIRFGIYDMSSKTLIRYINSDLVDKLDNNTIHILKSRLISSSQKQVLLPPLNELWELSLKKEVSFIDGNGLVELNDPTDINASADELQEKEDVDLSNRKELCLY